MGCEVVKIKGVKLKNGKLSAEDFKKIQEALGLTNADLAEKLGMSKRIVDSMRSGHRVVAPWTHKLLEYIVQAEGMVF